MGQGRCLRNAGGMPASFHSDQQAPPPGFLKPSAGPSVWKLENIVTPEWEVTTPEPTHNADLPPGEVGTPAHLKGGEENPTQPRAGLS